MRAPRIAATLTAVVLACAGCVAPGSYGRDRWLDLTDAIDLKYGTGIGLGVHLQATKYLETGLGLSTQSGSHEWFGRRRVDMHDGAFVHGVVVGFAGLGPHGSLTTGSIDVLLFNVLALEGGRWTGTRSWFEGGHGLPILDRYRFGAVLYLPGVHGGLFLNVGELADFLGGLFGADLMNDDGYAKPPEVAPDTR